mgnify:CR=1 FL=1
MNHQNHLSEDSTDLQVGRRSWLGAVIGLIGAGISATLGITGGRFVLAPVFSKFNTTANAKENGATEDGAKWIELGPLSAIPENQLVRKNILVSQDAGWGIFNAPRLLWIIRKGDDVTIFSGVCPHLGCSVNSKENSFVCACHGSYWNATGARVEGPSPRDLDTLKHQVENGILKVQYQDFKQGTPTKEVLS